MHALLIASILGGALSFEYRTSIRLYLSAPLVSGLITGAVLGAPLSGMLAGVMLQLLFFGSVRLRGMPEADLPTAGVVTSAVFVIVSRESGGTASSDGVILFWALLLGLVTAAAGSIFYTMWERMAARPAARGLEIAARGRTGITSAIHLALSTVHFAWGFMIVLIMLPAGLAGIRFLVGRLEVMEAGSMGSLPLLVPLVAAGAVLKLLGDRVHLFWFGAGFLITAVIVVFVGGI